MSAYLYTWNPRKWNWRDLREGISYVNNHDPHERRWSCGNTRKIEIGDVFFLMRLGVEPKGIVGCGYVSSVPFETWHWAQEQISEARMALYTRLFFLVLSERPIIYLDQLKSDCPVYNWTPQSSGTSIPEDVTSQLLSIVQTNWGSIFTQTHEVFFRKYIEGQPSIVTITTYDRSRPARQDCIGYYGYDCGVCGFNFETEYGDLGKYYIEVHHLKPISEIGEEHEIEPIRDLRPVCANCHAMLHRKKPVLSIEELRVHRK